MLKKTLLTVSLLSIFISGCSTDQRYKREVEGNENYLNAAPLKPLIVPNGMKMPTESNDYRIYKAAKEGEVGKQLDIRPPELPLSTLADSYATYGNGIIQLDAPANSEFWHKIPSVLDANNITIEKSDNSTITTGIRVINRDEGAAPVEASYSLKRHVTGGREYITIELTSLKQAGQNMSGLVEKQYYTVEFFNMLMNPSLATIDKISG